MKRDEDIYDSAPEDAADILMTAEAIADFLPPPEKLVLKEKTRKVTIALSERSVEFFKEKSKEIDVPYQQMIRKVLDNYAEAYSRSRRRD